MTQLFRRLIYPLIGRYVWARARRRYNVRRLMTR